jgi:hypothetical protein
MEKANRNLITKARYSKHQTVLFMEKKHIGSINISNSQYGNTFA